MNRRSKLVVVGLLTAAVLIGSLAAASSQEPQPEIVIPNPRHDFGQVDERATYEASYVVRNAGNADLVINQVKPT